MTERFIHEVSVRWSDMDAYGHVNNVARQEIDYVRPVNYGEPVRVELWISQLRAASFTVSYELFDDGVLASRARSVCVPYRLAEGHPRRLTDAERDFLRPYVGTH